MQVFSFKTKFYSSTNQLHVPAAVISPRQADPKDIKRNKPYSCSIGRKYQALLMCYSSCASYFHSQLARACQPDIQPVLQSVRYSRCSKLRQSLQIILCLPLYNTHHISVSLSSLRPDPKQTGDANVAKRYTDRR